MPGPMEWLGRLRARMIAWVRGMLAANLSPREVGWAVGVGVFVGLLPLFGLHLPLCVVLARQLKLNQVFTYAAAQLSNPITIPFIIVAEIGVGEMVRYGAIKPEDTADVSRVLSLDGWREAPELLLSCLIGSLVLGVLLAPLSGALAAWARRWWMGRGAG